MSPTLRKKILKLIYPLFQLKWRIFGKPDAVKVLLFHEDKVLLIQKSYKGDEWYLPGGFINPGETPEEAAEREVFEEIGVPTKHLVAGDDVGFSPKDDQHDVYTFVVDLAETDIHVDGVEIESARWFTLQELQQEVHAPEARDLLEAYYRSKETN